MHGVISMVAIYARNFHCQFDFLGSALQIFLLLPNLMKFAVCTYLVAHYTPLSQAHVLMFPIRNER